MQNDARMQRLWKLENVRKQQHQPVDFIVKLDVHQDEDQNRDVQDSWLVGMSRRNYHDWIDNDDIKFHNYHHIDVDVQDTRLVRRRFPLYYAILVTPTNFVFL